MNRVRSSLVLAALLAACGGGGTSPAPAPATAGSAAAAPPAPEPPSPSATADAAPPAPATPDASAPPPADAASDAPPAYPCAPTATAGHQKITCPDGVTMDVEISAACATGGCGIIFDVHGFTMTADEEDAHTRMRLLAPPLGYVVVQPTAAGLWGTGAHNALIWAFAQATHDVLETDPDRLHFMGFSQGAILTFEMLCAHADAIASVAPDSGNGCFSGTTPSVERPILYVEGTADNIQPWSLFGPPVRDSILKAWDFGPATQFSSGTGYAANRWTTSHGTDFEFWQHDYRASQFLGGHCLAVPNGVGQYKCTDAQFDYSAQVLRFFGAHPRGH